MITIEEFEKNMANSRNSMTDKEFDIYLCFWWDYFHRTYIWED